MKIRNILLSFVMLSLILSSCEEDFLETSPTDALSADVMFDSFDGAELALNGIYRTIYAFDGDGLGHHGAGYFGNVLDNDLLGEDMIRIDRGYGWYTGVYNWTDHRDADAGIPTGRWEFFYNIANQANIILLYADDIDDATQAEIDHVKGQARALRALSYYWLVQRYAHAYRLGDDNPGIPIYREPTQEGNPRSSVGEVYNFIVEDLEAAVELFNNSPDPYHKQHISHINLTVAHGLYARTALAMENYDDAAHYADEAINAGSGESLFTPGDFAEDAHLLVSSVADEWIWGVILTAEHAPGFASFMSHMDARFMTYAQLGGQVLLNAELYENMADSDGRKNWWIDPADAVEDDDHFIPYNNSKFLTPEEGSWASDLPLMRLAEMYLIKAEALARGGDEANAEQTLTEYMQSRDPNYGGPEGDLIDEIMFHRRIELWGEGFRFFDLQRTGTALNRITGDDYGYHDGGMANIVELDAGEDDWLFRIPQDEIDANEAITGDDQNP